VQVQVRWQWLNLIVVASVLRADSSHRLHTTTAAGDTRVNGHLGCLPAKRTGNGFANFHAQNLTALGQSANDLDSITTSDQMIMRAE
jgi:hypothetical protein